MSDVRSLPKAEDVAAALARLDALPEAGGLGSAIRSSLSTVANPARALASLESLIRAGSVPDSGTMGPLLRVLGASQTLATTLQTIPEAGLEWFSAATGIEAVSARDHVDELIAAIGPGALASEEVPRGLRRHKRKHLLRIGARDLLGLAPVEETMREISTLADGVIEVAVRHALVRLADEHGEPSEPLRFVVLAMGKLGGGELNFSSDVDLLYLYDGGGEGSPDGTPPQTLATRVAETVTRVLSERTADGFVFRVDLRLRPDGQNGPIVNRTTAALLYYESWGQTWERAAMLKARPVAGHLDVGEAFLDEMVPFVFRRYLDFATIEEIQEMKKRVHREHSRARLERDVKLGPGGIREVEFIVQVLQLIHGGRDERLRARSTLEALSAIARTGLVETAEAESLASAYRFLRDVEHKLQIVHERQTQTLPEDPLEERFLARRLGFHLSTDETGAGRVSETERFRAALEQCRTTVHGSFEKLFSGAKEDMPRPADEEERTLLRSLDDETATRDRLARMGFADPARAAEELRRLRDGPSASPASPRRRKALLELAPALFAEIRKSSNPDLALQHMSEFISAVGARTSFLVLLKENPETLRLLVGLFGSSRFLSNFFLRHPELLDSLVRADLAMVHKDREILEEELSSLLSAASDYESELDTLRRFRNEEFLRIGVNDIHGLLDFSEVLLQLSELAEACLGAALRIAVRVLAERFGAPPGRFAVVGMGKLGGSELTYNSDLDLIFVYDAKPDAEPGEISVHEYFTKLAQRLMAVLQLTTREGTVYKIDTRLRPSGAQGALVSSLEAYRRYHETSSALWERQALIRARGVAGDPSLIAEVEGINEGFVYGKSLRPEDVAEIARLRSRMEQELAREREDRWNVKTGRGGIVDVEFAVQMLQLRHGHDHPSVRRPRADGTRVALTRAELLPENDYQALHEGYRFLRRLENNLRIERDQPVEAFERDAAAALARRLGYAGDASAAAAELLADFERVRDSVRRAYDRTFVDTKGEAG